MSPLCNDILDLTDNMLDQCRQGAWNSAWDIEKKRRQLIRVLAKSSQSKSSTEEQIQLLKIIIESNNKITELVVSKQHKVSQEIAQLRKNQRHYSIYQENERL